MLFFCVIFLSCMFVFPLCVLFWLYYKGLWDWCEGVIGVGHNGLPIGLGVCLNGGLVSESRIRSESRAFNMVGRRLDV